MTPSDALLAARLRAGDEDAATELRAAYLPRVQALTSRILRDGADAEEVTQDVFAKATLRIGAYRGDAALSTWVYRIAFNESMSRLRRDRHARRASTEAARLDRETSLGDRTAPPERADPAPLPDEAVMLGEFRIALRRALADIPPPQAEATVLHFALGMSLREVAAAMHVNVNTAKSRAYRGRQRLAAEFSGLRRGAVMLYGGRR